MLGCLSFLIPDQACLIITRCNHKVISLVSCWKDNGSGISAKSKPLIVFYYYIILDLALTQDSYYKGSYLRSLFIQHNA